MPVSVRRLRASDAAALESFIVQHRDSSMFMRSNVRAGGLEYHDQRYQGTYVASFEAGVMTGVVGHAQSGMLLLQAPQTTTELALACVAESGRAVTGWTGPAPQVDEARRALHVEHEQVRYHQVEALYALMTSELLVPESLERGPVVCRAPNASEVETVREWRHLFELECLGAQDTAEDRDRAARGIDVMIAEARCWVLALHDQPVSFVALNAVLPDSAQLGSVYTPPFLRGRGFAKAAVAGAVLEARARGAARAVLFTSNPSAARSYAAVGFRQVGEFGVLLIKKPFVPAGLTRAPC